MTEYFEKSIWRLCSFVSGTAATKNTDCLKETRCLRNNLKTFCEDHLARIPFHISHKCFCFCFLLPNVSFECLFLLCSWLILSFEFFVKINPLYSVNTYCIDLFFWFDSLLHHSDNPQSSKRLDVMQSRVSMSFMKNHIIWIERTG